MTTPPTNHNSSPEQDPLPGSGWAFDGHGRLYDLSKPPRLRTYPAPEPIQWVNVTDLPTSLGKRAAVTHAGGILYDLRIVSPVYEHLGALWVNVVHEPQWWDWIDQNPRPDRIPRAVPYRAAQVWAEIREQRPAQEGPW